MKDLTKRNKIVKQHVVMLSRQPPIKADIRKYALCSVQNISSFIGVFKKKLSLAVNKQFDL